MVSESVLAPGDSIRPLRREEYERLAELGAFVDERVELIHGVIVRMNPQGAPRAGVIQRLNALLVRAAGTAVEVRVQLPLAVADDSEPEPDIAVVAAGDPFRAHPVTALLVVEVSGASLTKDRDAKLPLYAAAGVLEHWIVDVDAGVVEVYREPARGRYATLTSHGRDAVLSPGALPGAAIPVASFLPPAR